MGLGKAVAALGASVLLLLVGAAGVVLLAGDDGPPTAAQVLDRSAAWLARYDTVTFEARNRFTDAADESYTYRFRSEGSVEFEKGYRAIERYGFGLVTETLQLDEIVYVRDAESARDLPDAKWGKFDLGAAADRAGVAPFSQAPSPDSGSVFSPAELRAIVGAVRDPKLDDPDADGNQVVKAEVDVDEAFADQGELIESAELELRATKRGEPVRLILTLGQPDGELRVDLRFSDWGKRIDLSEPAASEIDPTPDLEEEALANFKEAPLLMPAALPDGWRITYADVIPAAETAENCRQAEIDFDDPDDPDGRYLWIYEMAPACGEETVPKGAKPFVAGGRAGWYRLEDIEGAEVLVGNLRVGDTLLAFETDLEPADLAVVLGDLRPLDFAFEPGVLAGVGQSRGA